MVQYILCFQAEPHSAHKHTSTHILILIHSNGWFIVWGNTLGWLIHFGRIHIWCWYYRYMRTLARRHCNTNRFKSQSPPIQIIFPHSCNFIFLYIFPLSSSLLSHFLDFFHSLVHIFSLRWHGQIFSLLPAEGGGRGRVIFPQMRVVLYIYCGTLYASMRGIHYIRLYCSTCVIAGRYRQVHTVHVRGVFTDTHAVPVLHMVGGREGGMKGYIYILYL